MGKSYRKPYAPITGADSAHDDKIIAARAVRRAQNAALRNAIALGMDWDEFFIPDIYECAHNEVWNWRRDGNQSLVRRSSQYNNPFAYNSWGWPNTIEATMERWRERQEHDEDYMARVVRK